ncbi:hypothetical protein ACIHIX_24575 [Streptomyces sp. NPDC051913]|uniref:hypothetical protein n=1 Tax=Streptomyces sp. NPDC051913 TaxID=3365676 RepID=UPI0037D2F0BB
MPTQHIGDSANTIAKVADNQQKMYDAKPSRTQPRAITDGFHYGFEDSSGISCDSAAITRATQLKPTHGITNAWLLHTLGADTSLHDHVWDPAAQNLAGVANSAKP